MAINVRRPPAPPAPHISAGSEDKAPETLQPDSLHEQFFHQLSQSYAIGSIPLGGMASQIGASFLKAESRPDPSPSPSNSQDSPVPSGGRNKSAEAADKTAPPKEKTAQEPHAPKKTKAGMTQKDSSPLKKTKGAEKETADQDVQPEDRDLRKDLTDGEAAPVISLLQESPVFFQGAESKDAFKDRRAHEGSPNISKGLKTPKNLPLTNLSKEKPLQKTEKNLEIFTDKKEKPLQNRQKESPEEELLKFFQQQDIGSKIDPQRSLSVHTSLKTLGPRKDSLGAAVEDNPGGEPQKAGGKEAAVDSLKKNVLSASSAQESEEFQSPAQDPSDTPQSTAPQVLQTTRQTEDEENTTQSRVASFKESLAPMTIKGADKKTPLKTPLQKTRPAAEAPKEEKTVERTARPETLRVHIIKSLQAGYRLIRVTLHPQHMGFVHVRLQTNVHGTDTLTLVASKAETLVLLNEQKNSLLEALKSLHIDIKEENIFLQLSHENAQQHSQQGRQKSRGTPRFSNPFDSETSQDSDLLFERLGGEIKEPLPYGNVRLDISI